jgi:hypothetical protein
MESSVKVTGDELGNVIHQSSNNPDYGYVRVEQIRTMYDDNSFLRRKVVSALIVGYMDDLKEEGYYAGQELPGKLVIVESLNPSNKNDHSKNLKVAGNTGVVCTLNGESIYRKTIYSIAINATDKLIKHDNVDEIKEANGTSKIKVSALNPSASDEFAID